MVMVRECVTERERLWPRFGRGQTISWLCPAEAGVLFLVVPRSLWFLADFNAFFVAFSPDCLLSAVATVSYNKDAETVTLEFPTELTPSLTEPIQMEYCGTLNDQMKGFYRSKYFHPSAPDEERYAAVTQFEVGLKVFRRRAFVVEDVRASSSIFSL